jgi:hypothetical protein
LKSWRCFHCNDVFTDREQAAEHFGPNLFDHTRPAACVDPLRYDELARCRELRAARANVEQARRDRDAAEVDADNYHSMRAELRRLFGPGVVSPSQAYLVLDEMEGRALAAEERAKRAEETLARHGLTISEAA